MAARKSVGRPQKQERRLSKQDILSTALPLIQTDGVDAISFRHLADKLGVTPMAVKYHVGSRQKMLVDLVALAFQGTIGDIETNSPKEHLREILSRYCKRALKHANLTRCILNDASLMSDDLLNATNEIRTKTKLLNKEDPDDVMLNLLVDYTHGFVFSAMTADSELSHEDYLRSLDWVLQLTAKE